MTTTTNLERNLTILECADRGLADVFDACVDPAMGLEEAAAVLRRELPAMFVYRGGRHIAIHRASGDPDRLLLVAESGAVQHRAERRTA